MAAILIVAGFAIAEKVEKKKQKKREKRASDEARYRELQRETSRRLSHSESGNVIDNTLFEDSEEPVEDDKEKTDANDAPPPSYEDAVQTESRREGESQAQMQPPRWSVSSEQGSRSRSFCRRRG